MSEEMLSEFEDGSSTFEKKKDAKKKQKVLSVLEMEIEVFNRGVEYWTSMYHWAFDVDCFTDKELSILNTTLRMKTNPPSGKQCAVILKIEQIAIEEGFSYKD